MRLDPTVELMVVAQEIRSSPFASRAAAADAGDLDLAPRIQPNFLARASPFSDLLLEFSDLSEVLGTKDRDACDALRRVGGRRVHGGFSGRCRRGGSAWKIS